MNVFGALENVSRTEKLKMHIISVQTSENGNVL